MANVIQTPNRNPLPINVISLYAQRGVQVIGRNPDVPAVAAYGRTLPPKVARFEEANAQLIQLKLDQTKLVTQAAEQAGDLNVATLSWRTRVQIDLDGLDPEQITVTETRAADVVLANARHLIELLAGRDAEAPDATQARTELEAKHSSTKAAFDALQVSRIAIQSKQRELSALAAEVHEELVKLRKTVRLNLGHLHADYQYLRIPRGRTPDEPASDAEADEPNDGTTPPSSTG